ncbi:MAG: hypothetical protein LCH54_18050, partial [Bacteroidetes bacterium]|nr:hypothetical protein [Bacteroidota bacterium]
MKKMILAFVAVLFFVNLTNAGPLDLITSKYKSGQITADQYYLNLYYYLYNPALVDLTLIPNPQEKVTCAADIPSDYQNEINLVSNSVRTLITTVEADVIAEADQSYISPSGYFSINYNPGKLTFADQADLNNNGYPDLIEQIGVWFDFAKNKLVDQAGFVSPLTSSELNQGLKYNVMIPGNNSTSQNSTYPGGSYIGLLIYPSNMNGNDPLGARMGEIKAGIAHEFKHAIQIATEHYQVDSFYRNFKHLDACWAEEFVFDESNSAYHFVQAFNSFYNPSMGMFDHNGVKSGSFSTASNCGYSDFLWHVFIHERYEGNSGTQAPFLKAFWEDRRLNPTDRLEATYDRVMYPVLGENATGKLVSEYFIWNYFTRLRSVKNSSGAVVFGYHDAALNAINDLNLGVQFPEVSAGDILTHDLSDLTLPVTYTGGKIMKLTNPGAVSQFSINTDGYTQGCFVAVAVKTGTTVNVYFIPDSGVPIVIPTGDEMILTGNYYHTNPIETSIYLNISTTPLTQVQTT